MTVRIVTGLIVLLSLGATLLGLARLHDDKETIFSGRGRGAPVGVRVEAEYLKLRHALERLATGQRDAGSLDGIQQEFNLFQSDVIAVMTVAGEGDLAGISEVERMLSAIDLASPGTIHAARDRLDELYRAFLPILLGLRTQHAEDAEHLHRIHVEMQVAFLVLLGSGGVLVLLLLAELRRSRRSYQELLRAERELKAGQAGLQDAIESVAGAFVLLDKDRRVVLLNEQFKAIYPMVGGEARPGVLLEDLIRIGYRRGQFRSDLDEESHVALRLQSLAEAGVPWEQTLSDGRVLLMDERRTSDGGTVSVRTDITHQKRIENMLRQRLAALEVAFDGIAILDQSATYTFVNDSHARIYGFEDAEELLGRSWQVLYDDAERRRLLAVAIPELEKGRRWQGEAVGMRRDGSRFPQELILATIEGGGFICIVRDISVRRQAEEERARLRAQFQQAQKLEEVGRLAGSIAHDFNNILTVMMGYATFLAEDLPAGSREQGFALQLVVAGDRARQLIHRILAFSRPQDAERRTLDLVRLVRETAELLGAMLPKTVELRVSLPGHECFARINPTQIGQVLLNLCVNAADAIGPAGGSIGITLETVEVEANMEGDVEIDSVPASGDAVPGGATRMRVGALKAGSHLRLSVTDSGCGIPRDVMERMFDPFFTTKEAGKGSGLGLASVHGIVSAHQGGLVVESVVGVGTRFDVSIPLVAAASPASAAEDEIRADIPGGRERVLIVDDELQVADMLAHALERLGYDVAACGSGDEALGILEEDPYAFDLIISDQMMPGLTGQRLARRLAELRPDLPVLLCTGASDGLDGADSPPNVAAVLPKPLEHWRLALAIRGILEGPPASSVGEQYGSPTRTGAGRRDVLFPDIGIGED